MTSILRSVLAGTIGVVVAGLGFTSPASAGNDSSPSRWSYNDGYDHGKGDRDTSRHHDHDHDHHHHHHHPSPH